MENYFTAMACNADLCAVNKTAQEWRERITLDAAVRDYRMRNGGNKDGNGH